MHSVVAPTGRDAVYDHQAAGGLGEFVGDDRAQRGDRGSGVVDFETDHSGLMGNSSRYGAPIAARGVMQGIRDELRAGKLYHLGLRAVVAAGMA
ncbi:MAG TPA: hypothetical protein VHO00_05485 [Actinomycetes bacterium]|nr:hypothetical protein [Actinomycetes bacterium]